MCIIYMTFYTAFITKEHFQIFGEMVQKVLKMRKCNLFFCQTCVTIVDRSRYLLLKGGGRLLYIICLVVCPLISGIAV